MSCVWLAYDEYGNLITSAWTRGELEMKLVCMGYVPEQLELLEEGPA